MTKIIKILTLLSLLILSFPLSSQNKRISGIVIDSLTNEPVPFVAIYLKGTNKGILANGEGQFQFNIDEKYDTITTSIMGYSPKNYALKDFNGSDIKLEIVPTGIKLNEVFVKPKKEKYTKKNNPAVLLVEKIIDRQHLTNPYNNANYNYEKYERITFALNDFTNQAQNSWIFEKFPFLTDHIDTSEISGKPILNVSIKEKSSNIHYRKNPKSQKEYITGIKRAGIDDITSQESLQIFIDDILREIDIYSNDITILGSRFVSPLSKIATNFYKYYLTDTISIDRDSCIELSFAPHNPISHGFTGRLYVLKNDSAMFIKRILMNIPPSINLNFVDNLYIKQDFQKLANGSRIKTKDDLTIEVSLIPGTQGLYARRKTSYSNHNFNPLQDHCIFNNIQNVITHEDAYFRDEHFWNTKRITPVSYTENNISNLVTKLRTVPIYYWTEKILKVIVSGYIHTSKDSKFDIGPVNSFVSYNDLEGFRLRAGGLTTANLNKRLFARGYIAYGTKDQKLKYGSELEYSFHDKKYHSREFPVHSLKLSHIYDVNMLGQHYQFTNNDNIFLSLKRKDDKQTIYERSTLLDYTLEFHNNFSIKAGIKHDRKEATVNMQFMDGYGNNYSHYNQCSFNIQLRYAPGEKFYQTKTKRYPVNLDAPVFILSHTFSPKSFIGSKYTINTTEISVQKRFWFSAFGNIDIILKAGHVWNQAPYPNLLIPNVNLSYTIQPESYSLMNPMEFINDSYASWDLTYYANGAILNYIPLLKRLKLREVFTFRGLYGHLSDKNNPNLNNNLFKFPEISHTCNMGSKPYMEMGIGIENIFKILRVDYIWRLTYKDTDNIDRHGIRIAVHFKF